MVHAPRVKTLYLDLFSGISGDMFLGAVLDLGVDFAQFNRELKKLGLTGYHLEAMRDSRMGIEGVKFDVHLDGHDHDHDHSHEHHNHHHHSHEHPGSISEEPTDSHGHSHEHAETHEHEPHDASGKVS